MATRTTLMTGSRGVGGIDRHHGHTSVLRLVHHELPELVEGPTVVAVALGFADPGALPNAGQVFESNLSSCGACRLDNLTANDMVERSHMPSLPTRQAFQGAFGALRPFGLEGTADCGVVGTQPHDGGGFVGSSIGIHRDTPSAQINTQRTGWCLERWGGTGELDMQKERPIPALAQCRLKALSTVEQGQAEGPVPFAETEYALIVVNRGGGKGRMGFFL